jgi:hypothetical protein
LVRAKLAPPCSWKIPLASLAFTGCDTGHSPSTASSHGGSVPVASVASVASLECGVSTGSGGYGNGRGCHVIVGAGRDFSYARQAA